MHLLRQEPFSKLCSIQYHNLHHIYHVLRCNKKHTKVYNQDCNLLLEHAIQVHNGKKLPPLKSLDGGKLLPPLPQPGEVDLICGGKYD
jgi:hypothetical protein